MPIELTSDDADPPPGAAVREPSTSTNWRTESDASGSSGWSSTMYSMMVLRGSKGFTELRPRRCATSMIFCFSSRMKRFSLRM